MTHRVADYEYAHLTERCEVQSTTDFLLLYLQCDEEASSNPTAWLAALIV